MNDEELDKDLAKMMINPNYFIVENLNIGFKINLEGHNVKQANCILNNATNFPESGIWD